MSLQQFLFDSLNEKNRIGSGGYGNVYRLENTEPPSVLKCFHHRDTIDTLKVECKALEELKHVNIVQYFGLIDETYHGHHILGLRMEYCENGDLRSWTFNPKATYSIFTVLRWAKHLFCAIDYLHDRKRIHRDIKTDNVLVDGDFVLKLGDFGLVKEVTKTVTGSYMGTERYMSPEVRFGNEEKIKSSTKNDIWGVGLVLWEIIERREVLSNSEYGKLQTLDAFQAALAREIEELMCPSALKTLVCESIHINFAQRSTAENALDLYQKCNSLVKGYELRPFIDETETNLWRPIGFDGTKKPTLIKIDAGFSILPLDLDTEVEPSQENDLPETFESIIAKHSDLSKLLRSDESEKLAGFFKNQTMEDLKIYSQRAQTEIRFFINETSIYDVELSKFFVSIYNTMLGIPNVSLRSRDDPNDSYIEDLTEAITVDICHHQLSTYYEVFNFIAFYKASTLTIWSHLIHVYSLQNAVTKQKTIFSKRFYFRTYFSMASKDEWLHVGSQKNHLFVRKDLNDAKIFSGIWQDADFEITEDGEGNENNVKMIYLDLYAVDIDMIVAALEQLKSGVLVFCKQKLKKMHSMDRQAQLAQNQGQDLPIKGYVFQLQNPPRSPCICPEKCPQIPRFPAELREDFRLKLPSCSSKSSISYLETFGFFCNCIFQNSFSPEISGYSDLRTVKEAEEKSQNIPCCFLFGKLKPPNEKLILLDLPKDHEKASQLNCIQENYKIGTITAAGKDLQEDFHEIYVFNYLKAMIHHNFVHGDKIILDRGIDHYSKIIPENSLLFHEYLRKMNKAKYYHTCEI